MGDRPTTRLVVAQVEREQLQASLLSDSFQHSAQQPGLSSFNLSTFTFTKLELISFSNGLSATGHPSSSIVDAFLGGLFGGQTGVRCGR